MIYTGLNNTGEVEAIYGHLNGVKSEVSEVYGSIDYNDPIFYSRKTLTGTSPLTFKALGQPLKDYHIFGETVQDGTPSPDYPVDAQGVGERTENLFDKDSPDVVRGKCFDQSGNIVNTVLSAITGYIPIKPDTFYSMFPKNGAVEWYGVFYDSEKNQISTFNVSGGGDGTSGQYIYKSPSNASYARLSVLNTEYYARTMYVEGIEKLVLSNIIPYGYKIPITIGNVTTPIYIGSDPLYRVGEYADEIASDGTLTRRNDVIDILADTSKILYVGWFRKNTSNEYRCFRFQRTTGVRKGISNYFLTHNTYYDGLRGPGEVTFMYADKIFAINFSVPAHIDTVEKCIQWLTDIYESTGKRPAFVWKS